MVQCKRCKNEAVENLTLCQNCREKQAAANKKWSSKPENKEKTKLRSKNHYEKNKREITERIKQYQKDHPEQRREISKKYKTNNAEKVKTRIKAHYEANKERLTAVTREYHRTHREQISAKDKLYCKNNPEKVRIKGHNYRARLRNVFVCAVNPTEIFERDGWICKICNEPVDRNAHHNDSKYPSVDHIIPITKGGTHEPANVQCAHRGCNSSKSNKYPISDPCVISVMLEFNRASLQTSGGIW